MAIIFRINLLIVLLSLKHASMLDFAENAADHYEFSEAKISQICSYVAQTCSKCTALQACLWCVNGNQEGKCIANFNRRSRYNCLGEIYVHGSICVQSDQSTSVSDNGRDFKSDEQEKSLLLKLIYMLKRIHHSHTANEEEPEVHTTPSEVSVSQSISSYKSLSMLLSEMIKAENDKLYNAFELQIGQPSRSQMKDLTRKIFQYLSTPGYKDTQDILVLKYLKVLRLIDQFNKTGAEPAPVVASQTKENQIDRTESELQRLEVEMNGSPDAANASLIANTTHSLEESIVLNNSNLFHFNLMKPCPLYNSANLCYENGNCSWCEASSTCIFASAGICGVSSITDSTVSINSQQGVVEGCSDKHSCGSCVKDTNCYWCSQTKSCDFFPGPAFVPDHCKNYMFHNVCSYEVTLLIVVVPLVFVVFFMGASYFCVKHCYYHQRTPVEVKLDDKPILFKTKNGRTIYQITESEEEEDEKYVADSQYQRLGKTQPVMW